VIGREERVADRRAMVESQLRGRDITDPTVLSAMGRVPRHRFVPDDFESDAYDDHPVPIGFGQTISQPYVVAFMTQAIEPRPGMKVLEIGTGSGYQAAILAEVVGTKGAVFSIEIVGDLARRAADTLRAMAYDNVHVRAGDGYEGWPDEAPFDAILITAAPPAVPTPLLRQLTIGGVLVAPIGEIEQNLVRYRRLEKGYERESLLPVRFVPMTGKAQGGGRP
jgi:protein-L-isoaspartate(D-aspartate) O-methyltransferase